MKNLVKLVIMRRLACGISLGIGLAASAATQPFVNSVACTIIPIGPSVPGQGNVSSHGLSEPDANDACYIAGQCSTYPLIQPSVLPAGTGWTIALDPTTTTGGLNPLPQLKGYLDAGIVFFTKPWFATPLVLPQLPLTSAVYANSTAAALTGAAATPSVRVGYTLIHLSTGLRYHATSWVINGTQTAFVPNDLDAGPAYVSSRVYGVVFRPGDSSILAVGAGANTNGRGYTSEQPVYWLLNGNGTVSSGPNALAVNAANRDVFAYAASTRSDFGTIVGTGSDTLNGYNSKWAQYWSGFASLPVNLNDPANNTAAMPVTKAGRNNPNAGGAAYAVASFPDAPTQDDIVGGMIQRYIPLAGGRTVLRTRACVWLSDKGGGPTFTPILMPDNGAQLNAGVTMLNSEARGVNSSGYAVGTCSFSMAAGFQGWRGYVMKAMGVATFYNIVPATDGFTNARWVVTSVKAVNNAGWMIGTARIGSSYDQDVLVIPNGPNGGPNINLTPAVWDSFNLPTPKNG